MMGNQSHTGGTAGPIATQSTVEGKSLVVRKIRSDVDSWGCSQPAIAKGHLQVTDASVRTEEAQLGSPATCLIYLPFTFPS
jgi:hypothetical protein